MRASIITTICLATLLLAPLSSAQRDFTSNDGKKLSAEIASATETKVTLKRAKDGKEFTIPLARLSEEDQKFIGKWLAKEMLNTRPARKLTLYFDGGKTKVVDIPKGEYLSKDGTLTLYPGDTIHLEFDEQKEKGGIPHVVSEVKKPKSTITFTMTQKADGTILSRNTKIHKTVAMDCKHGGLGMDDFFRTLLMPTEKGIGGYDIWANTVWTLRLSSFEMTDRSASKVYEERISK